MKAPKYPYQARLVTEFGGTCYKLATSIEDARSKLPKMVHSHNTYKLGRFDKARPAIASLTICDSKGNEIETVMPEAL